MKLDDLLFSDASPRDFYDLIGVKRFDPDREAVLRSLRDVVRRLMQYERHEKRDVAKRAMLVQREAAQADRTLRDHDLLRKAHLEMLQGLAEAWQAAAGGDPKAWLVEQDVHPDRVVLIASALQTGIFAAVADALDWVDVAEAVPETVSDHGPAGTDMPTPPDLLPVRALPLGGPSPSSVGRGLPQPVSAAGPQLPAAIPVPTASRMPGSFPPPPPPPPPRTRRPVIATNAKSAPTPVVSKSRTRAYVTVGLLVGIACLGAAWWTSGSKSVVAPSLAPIGDILVDEDALLDFALPITADKPEEIAAADLELTGVIPPQLRFVPAERRLTWQTTEADGPSKIPLQIRFRRARWHAPDEVRSFQIVVREVNRPPQVRTPLKLSGSPGSIVSGPLDVYDPDVPANHVRLELVDPQAKGAVNHPMAGHVTLFADDKAAGTRTLKVRLIDDGTPPASSETTVIAEISTYSYSSSSVVGGPSAPTPSSATPSAASPTSTPPTPAASGTGGAVAPAPANVPPTAPAGTELASDRAPDLSRAPKLYECDFDREVPEFPERTSGAFIVSTGGGSLHLMRNPAVPNSSTGRPLLYFGSLANFKVSDFACEARVRFTAAAAADIGVALDRVRNRFSINNGSSTRFLFIPAIATFPAGIQPLPDWNALLMVVRNRKVTVYLNGVRVGGPVDVHNDTQLPGEVHLRFSGDLGGSCEVDKFTIWNLSGTEVAASGPPAPSPPVVPSVPPPAAQPAATPPSSPAVVSNLPPALNLERYAKIYETDFSRGEDAFTTQSTSISVSAIDGVMRAQRAVNDEGRAAYALWSRPRNAVSDFACEIRCRFVGDGDCTAGISLSEGLDAFRNHFSVDNGASDRYTLISERGSLPTGSLGTRRGEWHSMLLVVRDRSATAYFDGVKVGGPVALHAEAQLPIVPTVFVVTGRDVALELDHFSLWDLTKSAPTPTPAPEKLVRDYDSVDLPPLVVADAPTNLLPDYCRPDEVAAIAPELAINEDAGTRGLKFLLTPAKSAGSDVRVWNVVPELNNVAKPAVAQLLLNGGALGFRWVDADPVGEQLRNCVLLAKNPARPEVVFRKFVRLPPIAIDVKNGRGTAALCEGAGLLRLDGLRWRITGSSGFPAGTSMPGGELGGGQQAAFLFNTGQIELQWKLNLTKTKNELHCAHVAQAVDGKKIVTLTAPLIRSETNSLAKQQAALLQQIQSILVAKAQLELRRPFVSTLSEVNAFNAQVNQHNANVARLQAQADQVKQREDVFSQVVGTVEKMEGMTTVNLRVFIRVGGRDYDVIRAE